MKTLSIILMLWVYSVSIVGFIEIFKLINQDILVIGYSSDYLAIIFGIIGIMLGTGFYFLSILPLTIKKIIRIGIPSIILLILLFSYLIADLPGFFDLLYNLIKVGVFFLVCGLPSIAMYSLLKNQKSVLLACGGGIMIFFFMIIFLSQLIKIDLLTVYGEENIPILLLFFILFLMFIELGSNSIYYSNTLKKMTPNEYIDTHMLSRYNRVINNQIIYSSAVLLICYFASLMLLWNNNYSRYLQIDEIFGISATSYFGIILLVFFTLTGLILLWFLIPREKKEENITEI